MIRYLPLSSDHVLRSLRFGWHSLTWRRACLTAATLFVLPVTLSIRTVDYVPATAVLATIALVAVTAIRPTTGVGAGLVLIPLSGLMGTAWPGSVQWAEVLALAIAAGWLLRRTWQAWTSVEDDRPGLLVASCAALAAAVALSALMQLAIWQLQRAFWPDYLQAFCRVLFGTFFVEMRDFPFIHPAALLIEGVLLLLAAREAARRSQRDGRVLMAAAAGGAVAAGLLNASRLGEIALRTGRFWLALPELLETVRINTLFPDVNAAGSGFALTLCLAIGLACLERRRAVAWTAAAGVLALSLWLSGSRAALAGATLGVTMIALLWRGPGMARRMTALGAAAALAIVVGLALWQYPKTRNVSIDRAVQVRAEMAHAGMMMLRSSPIYGVGIGQFYTRSSEYMSDELRSVYSAENAHNNYIQIAAEIGPLGLAAFMLIVAALFMPLLDVAGQPAHRALFVCSGALAAFLLTCFTSHPLLTREPAYLFWMTGGLAAALGEGQRPLRAPWAAGLLRWGLIVMACFAPMHVLAVRGAQDLSGVAIGVTAAPGQVPGARVRLARGPSRFFVPATWDQVALSLRAAPGSNAPTRQVTVRCKGAAQTVTVDATRWVDVILPLAPATARTGFVAVDITQEGGTDDPGIDADGFPTGGVLIAGPAAQPQQNLTR